MGGGWRGGVVGKLMNRSGEKETSVVVFGGGGGWIDVCNNIV